LRRQAAPGKFRITSLNFDWGRSPQPDRGTLTIDGNVSGSGSALIDDTASMEFGGTLNESIVLDADPAGTLKFDYSVNLSGVLSGYLWLRKSMAAIHWGDANEPEFLERHDWEKWAAQTKAGESICFAVRG
jgi:hypothetical protein